MSGTSRISGQRLGELDHIWQSVVDILTTPIGSRVGRRAYGSRLMDLIDSPIGARSLADVTEAVFDALRKWEPRLVLTRVRLAEASAAGGLTLSLETQINGAAVTLSGIAL